MVNSIVTMISNLSTNTNKGIFQVVTIPLLLLFSNFGFGLFAPLLWARGQNSQDGPAVTVRTSQNRTHYYSTTEENEESDKLVIGKETVAKPGIVFNFGGVLIHEGGLKDTVYPSIGELKEGEMVLHLEARANWSTKSEIILPKGAVYGGFVGYLDIQAKIKNQTTGQTNKVDLTPHINLQNNLHYARNIKIPGEITTDLYTVAFTIRSAVGKPSLEIVKDWKKRYGAKLIKKTVFVYRNVAFTEVAL